MSASSSGAELAPIPPAREHPRTIGWLGTTALAMGGINQSLFLIGALLAGQESIPGQGTAAIPLLFVGLILAWMATPGWTELICMFPNRVGGIAATCGEAFRPYAPVLGNLTGMCYWWGWVPTCGLTALLSASAIHQWFLPHVPVPLLASLIVAGFAAINLCGVRWASRLAIPIATASASLAFLSAIIPVFARRVDWHQALSFHLETPFPGWFGKVTSVMAGLYLVGFAAPAFEAAACHVGETINFKRNVPRAMYASAALATLYFLILPVIWLGTIGSDALAGDLAVTLGPTFAPLLGGVAKSAAIWFMMFNMFHGTLAPLTGVARTLSQLAEDGLLPEFFANRNRFDCPWIAITVTAASAIVFLLIGDPIWLVAAANLTYLIGIALPNVAVWLLRRDQPQMPRPYRAPRGTILLGVIAAVVWGVSTVLGFQQFGLPTVLIGLALAYSGAGLYAWRKYADRRKAGLKGIGGSLHVKLTGAMLVVLVLDGVGYLIAVHNVPNHNTALVAALEDIFVAVAVLTITVGLVLPGMIAHSAVEVSKAAKKLATGTLADFSRAMEALSAGRLEAAHARVEIEPVVVHSNDELGEMAHSFNDLQDEIRRAAIGLHGARDGLRHARAQLTEMNAGLERRVADRTRELEDAHRKLVETARKAGMAEVAIGVLHNVGNVLNSVNISADIVTGKLRDSEVTSLRRAAEMINEHKDDLGVYLRDDQRGRLLPDFLVEVAHCISQEQTTMLAELGALTRGIEHIKEIVSSQQSLAKSDAILEPTDPARLVETALGLEGGSLERHGVTVRRELAGTTPVPMDRHRVLQVLVNLISNAKQAVKANGSPEKIVTISARILSDGAGEPDGERWLVLSVSDNGVGIDPEHLTQIFAHGFTTKPDGHGFGLHSAANAAAEMGGRLSAASDGPGRGATFTLELPILSAKPQPVEA